MRGRGVERTYLDLAYYLQELGCRVDLILREAEITLDVSAITHMHILSSKSTPQKSDELYELLNRLHHEMPIDLIVSSNVSFLKKSGFLHPRIFYTVNMSWGYRLLKRLRLRKYLQVRKEYHRQKVIAVSKGVAYDLLHLLRIKPARIDVIYDPYDIDAIRQKAAAKILLPASRPYIVHVGAFDKIKRHDILLKAFALLKEDIDLYLIGEGKREQKIKKLCKKLGLCDRVYFLGWQDNPYAYIKQAKATVLSSESEALPRVLIESLIVGTTAVSTDCKFGPSEILNEGLQSYLAKVNDPRSLAEKISYALQTPADIKPVHFERFSKEVIVGKYLNLIDID